MYVSELLLLTIMPLLVLLVLLVLRALVAGVCILVRRKMFCALIRITLHKIRLLLL